MKIEKKIKDKLLKFNSFIITTHIDPDGDAIGSQLLLRRLLKRLNKKVVMVNVNSTPANLKFLPGVKSIKLSRDYKVDFNKFDTLVALDIANPHRVGRMSKVISSAEYVINIDHHISNSNFGDLNWVERDVSCVGEMIYRLYGYLGLELDYKDALLSYVSIATDTGYFRHENTTSETHRIAASLIDKGVKPNVVYSELFENKSLSKMRIFAYALSSLEKRDCMAWVDISKKALKRSTAKREELEGLIDSVKTLRGIKVAMVFQELDDGIIKIGFRSKEKRVDVDKIAAIFGGGGHKMASGCRVKGTLSGVKKRVLSIVAEYLKKG
ncbi:MAG: bifunctional oligoribonuclease/PAP phosphatase NrnA [Candidatus Kaelpia imicola]|nr:bifunctional oligoribonuclease/PAP phosphatase NrnA [Candidatus Kaelpia imicola]